MADDQQDNRAFLLQIKLAIDTLFDDMRKRIDCGATDAWKDADGVYTMPWGNSTQFKLEKALDLLNEKLGVTPNECGDN